MALAGVLFAEPELLLLDEPTNHLDLEATIWLENYLRNYPHTILLVSHDRDLLNKVPTTTVHLDQGKLTSYAGGYDQFERTRRATWSGWPPTRPSRSPSASISSPIIDRFRYKASKARQAQSRIKMLERMEPIISIVEDHTVTFDFPSPNELAPPLIQLEGVDVGYDGKAILRDLDLRIDMDDRIALLGANGNGKSTLVKLLAGRLAPMTGEFRKSSKLKVGYFAQHQAEALDLNLTAVAQAKLWMKGIAGGKGPRPSRPLRLSPAEGGHPDRQAVRWREGAAPVRPDDPGSSPHPDAGRADQPSGHRQPRSPDPGDQRV